MAVEVESRRRDLHTVTLSHPEGLRVLVITNVPQPAVNAYLAPLAAWEDIAEIVVVRDRPDIRCGPKMRLVTPPVWWPRSLVTRLVGRAWVLRREIGRRPPHLMMTVHWFPDGPVALRLARRLGIPLIANIIGSRAELSDGGRRLALAPLPGLLKRRAEEYQRSCLNGVSLVTLTGRSTLEWFRAAGVNRPALRVLHAAIDTTRFCDHGERRDVDVAFVGRVHPDKRIDRLFRVLAGVGQHRPDLRATLVGVRREEADRFEEFGPAREVLGSRLVCLGQVENVADILRRTKVLLLTSDTEGRSLAALEAMACGAVPVVTEVGDMLEALDGGRAGVAIPKDEDEGVVVDRLAAAIVGLLEDESRRAALAARGQDHVKREHAPSRTQEEWREVLDSALVAPCRG